MRLKSLIVLMGPTAVGKTVLSVELAQVLTTEILSCDSRQFYKELSIGTAKPTKEEMGGIPHHFINSHSIKEDLNASKYELLALEKIDELFKKHDLLILTGGSGLYIDALCDGFDDEVPTADEAIREQLNQQLEEEGIVPLQEELKRLDPLFYQEIDLHNHKRLLRALEVCKITGKPYSSIRKGKKKERPFNIIKIGLNREREELYNRIDQRVDVMITNGLVEEARSVLPYRNHNALKTVGYRELFTYFDGEWNLDLAIEKIKTNSRRYAKRQLTWFNKDTSIKWFNPVDKQAIMDYILLKRIA